MQVEEVDTGHWRPDNEEQRANIARIILSSVFSNQAESEPLSPFCWFIEIQKFLFECEQDFAYKKNY